MISLGARITRSIIRLYTYPYRKRHASLSRSIKLRNKPYKPPRNCRYEEIDLNGTKIEILSEKESTQETYLVQFHGGGHTQAMNGIYRKVAERLCTLTHCPVCSIDYHAGENLVYPSLHDECYSAFVGLLNGRLKGKRTVAIGDSFGANIMLSACLRLRDHGMPLPSALICVSGFLDMAATGSSYLKNCYSDPLYSLPRNQSFAKNEQCIRRKTPYCGKTSPYDCLLSPAYAEYHDFPPMLIQSGDCETSESDNDMLYERALKSGVRVKLTKYRGMWHDFQYLTPFLKESKQAWNEIKNFVAEAVSISDSDKATDGTVRF